MCNTELWDLYDRDRHPLGIGHVRGKVLPDGAYHIVVHVWIKNEDDKYLMSQRHESRPTFPLMWECVGGSVLKGEGSLEGAIREAEEELGIKLAADDGRLIFTRIRGENSGSILDVWEFTYNGVVDLSLATELEVARTNWMSREEIKKLYYDEKLVGTLAYFFEM